MSGEQVAESEVGWHGLAGDRRYAFVRNGDASGLPFLSGRQVPTLTLYRASYIDVANPDRSPAQVVTPTGEALAMDSPALVAELEGLSGRSLHLQHLSRGCFDAMDISLITVDSIRTIGNAIGRSLEPLRFRPNIVLQVTEPGPFAEESWLGETLRFGAGDDAAWVQAARRDQRCVVVNLDPATACAAPPRCWRR